VARLRDQVVRMAEKPDGVRDRNGDSSHRLEGYVLSRVTKIARRNRRSLIAGQCAEPARYLVRSE
jgi:hypothetical protein